MIRIGSDTDIGMNRNSSNCLGMHSYSILLLGKLIFHKDDFSRKIWSLFVVEPNAAEHIYNIDFPPSDNRTPFIGYLPPSCLFCRIYILFFHICIAKTVSCLQKTNEIHFLETTLALSSYL